MSARAAADTSSNASWMLINAHTRRMGLHAWPASNAHTRFIPEACAACDRPASGPAVVLVVVMLSSDRSFFPSAPRAVPPQEFALGSTHAHVWQAERSCRLTYRVPWLDQVHCVVFRVTNDFSIVAQDASKFREFVARPDRESGDSRTVSL